MENGNISDVSTVKQVNKYRIKKSKKSLDKEFEDSEKLNLEFTRQRE